MTTKEILINAKAASKDISLITTEQKNEALFTMAQELICASDDILMANAEDLKAAEATVSKVMLDRLMLNKQRIAAMADGIKAVAKLPDPVGQELSSYECENGLSVKKISVPLGVVAIIYESRPNVTSDAAALTLKSGNVCVLRGGKEAFGTSFAIVQALRAALKKCNLNENFINILEDTSRAGANELMTAVGFVDLLIPRGGAGLINACIQNAKVPCIQTGTGICHIYIDKSADIEKALKIVENAKMSRPSVCNAAEVCVVHKDIANEFLPALKALLCDDTKEHTAKLILDKAASLIIEGVTAKDTDFDTEFLDYILAIKIVDSIDDAIEHICAHSTHHSEAIISEDKAAQNRFVAAIDSAAVYINASTRFTDGGEFGLGCEMGISTQKLHARGPMGLQELNTYKYVITGNGHIR